MQHSAIPLPPDPAALSAIPVGMLADTIERLIAELDTRDGDPDVEPNGDELDGSMGEDDFHTASEGGLTYPGCPISDPPESTFTEWQSLSASARRAGHIDGRALPGIWIAGDDAEHDDQDSCLAADDDPNRRFLDGLPGDRADAEEGGDHEMNGDEGDHSAGGRPCRYGVDQSKGPLLPWSREVEVEPDNHPSYARPRADDGITPDDCPETYASTARGTCLEPVYRDGACLVFSKSGPVAAGDFVGVWFKPGEQPPGSHQRWVKRLVMGLMPGMSLPLNPATTGSLEPLVIIEQLNPPRRYTIPASRLCAIHKVVGVAESKGDGQATWSPPKG